MGRGREITEATHIGHVQEPKGTFEPYEKEEKEQRELISALISTLKHFFGPFKRLFCEVADLRNPHKITYPLAGLAFSGVLMFLCHLQSRRQIGLLLRNGPAALKFQSIFGVETCPHGDTLNNAFMDIDAEQVQETVSVMTETLIRQKVLYPYRLMETYFVVAVDGTGVLVYNQRHCPYCLTRVSKEGKTTYYHNVLEAKLITPNGFAFSLMTEFIENPGENPIKQDCELKAFYRLAARLKKRFPRLPILMTMDGLFAGGPTFGLCTSYGWKFMIVLKDKDLPSVNSEFIALAKLQSRNQLSWSTGKKAEIRQQYRWVDDISYRDSAARDHIVAVIECKETKPGRNAIEETTTHRWVSNYKIKAENVVALANDGGRIRWKIENEGFNMQKNGGYALEHGYTQNPNAAKVFYFLLQIAHMLIQLMDKGSLLKKAFPSGFGSLKNLSFRLLEAWRNAHLTTFDFRAILYAHFQIRFDLDSS